MKKLLSILICLVLAVSSTWAADLTINAKAYVYNSIGGKVAANQSTTPPTTDNSWGTSATSSFKKDPDKTSGLFGRNSEWYGYTLYYHALTSQGYTFIGWSNDDNESADNQPISTLIDVSSSATIKNNGLGGSVTVNAATRYAIFKPIVAPSVSEIVLFLAEDGSLSSTTFSATFNKTTSASITCSHDLFSIQEDAASVLTGDEGQDVTIKVSKNNFATGTIQISEDIYTLTITPSNTNLTTQEYNPAPIVLPIRVREAPTVTFNPATGGSYTFMQDNGLQETISVTTEQEQAGVVGNGNDKVFALSATAADGYRFRRWVIDREVGDDSFLYDASTSVTIECNATVTAEFVSTDCAQFIVVGYPDKQYAYLDDAFDAAMKLGKTVVSVYQPGTVNVKMNGSGIVSSITRPTTYQYEWVLPKPTSGTYTIPAGYTLLVPGLEKSNLTGTASTTETKSVGYTYLLTKTGEDDYVTTSPSPAAICKLKVESGTTIQVNGNISVYSCLSSTQGYTGRPTGYGQIHLENGSQIQVNSGGILHVLGYITGDPQQSSVVGKSGATIYETFQLTDWRGGSAMMSGNIVNNDNEVFPDAQYYVQNIETMLELEYGAKECLTTAVTVSDPFPVTTDFVTNMTSGEDLGLFALGSGTKLQKYYDSTTDRLKINLIGTGENAEAELSYMYLEVKVKVIITLDYSLDSREYVLPINNNIDVSLDNVKMHIPYKLAFMAGSSLTVSANSKLNIQNEVYLYDRELNVRPDFTEPVKNTDGKIVSYGGYNGSGDYPLKPITYTAYHGKAPGIRTSEYVRYPEKLTDATFIIDGTLTMEGSGALYTTTYGSAIQGLTDTSNEALVRDFGANITSNGGGVLNFNTIGLESTTNQINQPGTDVNWVTNIPVCNAWLRNADGTREGGPDIDPNTTYMYDDAQGKWIIPTADLRNHQGNDFYLTLPANVTQNVTSEVVANGVTINSITKLSFEGSQFTVGNPNHADGKVTIPVTYTHTGIHNFGSTPNEGKIVLRISYNDPIAGAKTKDVTINLSGVENYKPAFSVAAVNQSGDTVSLADGATYSMTALAGIPTTSPFIITPAENNVAETLGAAGWTKDVATPFAFAYGSTAQTLLSEAALSYEPTAFTAEDAPDTDTLTLTASYTDAASASVDSTITIYLTGTANRQPSALAFEPTVMGDSIFQTQTIEDIFAHTGNSNAISFTFDGQPTHELVTIESNGNNYRLIANQVDDVDEPQTIEIVATQLGDNTMRGNTISMQITVLPPVAWNWGILYFNSTTTTIPVITESNEAWTLTVLDNPETLIQSLTPDATNGYVATVGTPADPTQTYTVTFLFKLGSYQKEFTSLVYADPRIVSYCVDTERTFQGVTIAQSTTGVTFDDATNTATFAKSGIWEVELRGVPNTITFTPTGTNAWRVLERASSTDDWSAVAQWTNTFVDGEQQVLSLKPTTRFVQIQYGAQTENAGTVKDLCISKLEYAANADTLYLPIYTNTAETSQKKIVLTRTNATAPTVTLQSPLTYSIVSSANLGTTEEPFYNDTITVSAAHTTAEGKYTLTATSGGATATVIVRTYNFPQELPIKWSEDEAERFYFTMTESRLAKWNAKDKQLLFQNPGEPLRRSVTFAFNGAPSIIKFNLSEDIVDADWTIEESVDGKSYSTNVAGRDTVAGNTLTHQLNYTTRYVRVSYNTTLTREVILSDLVIEGYPQVIVKPTNMFFTTDTKKQHLYMIAINLQEVDFVIDNTSAFQITTDTTFATGWGNSVHATEATHETALGLNKVDTIFLGVQWLQPTALDEGKLTITSKTHNDSVLAVIPLLGSDSYITIDKAENTGISTGIPDGYTYHGSAYTEYDHHEVKLTNAFTTDGTAMFDYLFIYGETTPASETNITAPQRGSADGSTNIGSNAVTPLIVYKKAVNADNQYKGYEFVGKVDNVNVADKAAVGDVIIKDTADVIHINVQDTALSVYMTGFCPYATTGYTKNQEGVFLFRGTHGATLDVYLEDFHVSSRNKTKNGNGFYGKEGGETYSDSYARGSGGVLVFENVDAQEQLQNFVPFEVNIHTTGNNLLNSNHGCFFALAMGGVTMMKATQVSSPIQVHMFGEGYERKTKTTLNFDDIWPTAVDVNNEITDSYRTNGFLALKKQANNAPSIDMGNQYTEVNFKGGRVELQNSQIGSDTYKTTLAISYRAGFFGAEEAGIQLCHGIGTDAVDGTVNFLDGTVTVERMKVDSAYRQYYLMDTLADGTESEYTTCLRTPKNTFVRGGSICRVRACQSVISKGGGPKDTQTGSLLGQYVYTLQEGDELYANNLVKTIAFPDNIENLRVYQTSRNYTYGLSSVTPDANNKLYFWIPDGYGGVTAEKDVFMATWKACMTKIGAGLAGVAEGEVGGDTEISSDEEVQNFLYCQLDDNIYNVISAGIEDAEGNKTYTYEAPIEVPAAAKNFFNGDYTRWAPNLVGDAKQHEVTSETTYTIANRVYYITTATADLWQTFTAPFDVANIYVVETYSESELEEVGTRTEILKEQARHNADFAAFFGVAMAMGSMKDFDGIYDSYIKWAKIEDDSLGLYTTGDTYTLRGKTKLTPYTGKNWREANFYLNHNNGNWDMTVQEDSLRTKWEVLKQSDIDDGILLHKGETYSLMFPYCTGCEFEFSERTYWDYWSGKFLIFESTAAPQTINGRDFLDDTKSGNIFETTPTGSEVVVTGNSTFSYLTTSNSNVYRYTDGYPSMVAEGFVPVTEETTIYPVNAFLYGDVPVNASGMPARKITRAGKIIYDVDNSGDGTTTDNNQGGNIPTVGGGNDLFITSTVEGINIAVAEPQHVRVLSSTGAVLYSGMVQTAVDVALPTTGVYVITGENEVHKILH